MEYTEKNSFNLTYSASPELGIKPNLISLSSVDIINQAISSGKDPFWFQIIPYEDPQYPPLEIGTAIFNRNAFFPRLARGIWSYLDNLRYPPDTRAPSTDADVAETKVIVSPEAVAIFQDAGSVGRNATKSFNDFKNEPNRSSENKFFSISTVSHGDASAAEYTSRKLEEMVRALMATGMSYIDAIKAAHSTLQAELRHNNSSGGASVATAYFEKDRMDFSHIGDTAMFLVRRDPSGDNSVDQLTISDSPRFQSEKDRIEAAGGVVSENLGSYEIDDKPVSVSRGLGFTDFNANIISSEPHVQSHTFDGSEKYLIGGGRGLYSIGPEISDIVNNYSFPNHIARKLGEKIKESDIGDEIAVMVLPFKFERDDTQNSADTTTEEERQRAARRQRVARRELNFGAAILLGLGLLLCCTAGLVNREGLLERFNQGGANKPITSAQKEDDTVKFTGKNFIVKDSFKNPDAYFGNKVNNENISSLKGLAEALLVEDKQEFNPSNLLFPNGFHPWETRNLPNSDGEKYWKQYYSDGIPWKEGQGPKGTLHNREVALITQFIVKNTDNGQNVFDLSCIPSPRFDCEPEVVIKHHQPFSKPADVEALLTEYRKNPSSMPIDPLALAIAQGRQIDSTTLSRILS